MQTFNANYFEDYGSYIAKKTSSFYKKKNLKPKSRKKRRKKIQEHNSKINEISDCFAEDMKTAPSELEKRMQQFLDNYSIQYEFQKVLNIKRKNGKIRRFYIADFYIPSKNLIIETDGAFHDNQVKEDTLRTKQIMFHYPNMKIIRWRWHDFDSASKKAELLKEVR